MSLSDYAENLLLNFCFNTETATRPTAWYLSLHTADPTDDGTVGEVIVGDDADYVRPTLGATGLGAASAGQAVSLAAISHTPAVAAVAYTVTHVAIWDASTAGNCLMIGSLAVSRLIDNSNPFVISIGDLVALLD